MVKDDITNGVATRALIQAVRNMGGTVIGVGIICNKGVITEGCLNVPKFEALVTVPMKIFSEHDCKISGPCSEGIPISRDYSQRGVVRI